MTKQYTYLLIPNKNPCSVNLCFISTKSNFSNKTFLVGYIFYTVPITMSALIESTWFSLYAHVHNANYLKRWSYKKNLKWIKYDKYIARLSKSDKKVKQRLVILCKLTGKIYEII